MIKGGNSHKEEIIARVTVMKVTPGVATANVASFESSYYQHC